MEIEDVARAHTEITAALVTAMAALAAVVARQPGMDAEAFRTDLTAVYSRMAERHPSVAARAILGQLSQETGAALGTAG